MTDSQFVCVTVSKADKDRFDHALSDILCWLNGFTQGGGEYSPETQYDLRDIQDMLRRAYPTIPPSPVIAENLTSPPLIQTKERKLKHANRHS